MERLGGLLIGLAVAWMSLSICAGGLCAEATATKKASEEVRG